MGWPLLNVVDPETCQRPSRRPPSRCSFLRNGTLRVEGADCVNARAASISAHGVGRIVGLRREAVRVFILYTVLDPPPLPKSCA